VVHVGDRRSTEQRSPAHVRSTTGWSTESTDDDYEDGGIIVVAAFVAVAIGIGIYLYIRSRRRKQRVAEQAPEDRQPFRADRRGP
jgi:hypothetical protein